MKCVVCGNYSWIDIFNRLSTDFVMCDNCGLIRMKIIPTPEEISSYYEKKSVGGNYSLSYTMSEDHSLDYDSVFKDFVEFTKIN